MKRKKMNPAKKKSSNKNSLLMYDTINFEDHIKIMGRFCNLSYSTKDWIETKRFEQIEKANKYEILFGEYLMMKNIKFIHQAPFVIDNKIYFLDFFIPEYRLAVEIDGSYHYGITQSEKDIYRENQFKSIGVKTIRLNNNETLDKKQMNIRLSLL